MRYRLDRYTVLIVVLFVTAVLACWSISKLHPPEQPSPPTTHKHR